jgi:hypothetical protein
MALRYIERMNLWRQSLSLIGLILASCIYASADVTLQPGQGLGTDAIMIHSDIRKGDFDRFAKAAGSKHGILVKLDSSGGDVIEALKIGRLIRRNFMWTEVTPNSRCASACVFILQAGVARFADDQSQIIVHRPTFDAASFSGLDDEAARNAYNNMVSNLRIYFIDEMGGSEEAFRLIMATPSSAPRMLTDEEISRLGLIGKDPAFEAHLEAKLIGKYGPRRWPLLKECMNKFIPLQDGAGFKACQNRVYELYPIDP